MPNRISKLIVVTGVSAALAVGGAGIAQASPDHGGRHGKDDACKRLKGKQKRECIKRHEKHHGPNHD